MYRSLVLSVLLVCICPSQSSIETDVQALIKKIQDAIPEPINIPEAHIIVPDNQFISGFLNLANITETGLKDFDLKVKFAFGILPQNFKFNLKKLELDTNYLLRILTIIEFGFPEDIWTRKSTFTITGFMDDEHISEEISEGVTRVITSTVNTDEFSTLVQDVLNSIIASFTKHTSITRDSSEGMDDYMDAGESLNILDLLGMFTIWIDNIFRSYKSLS